MPKISRHRGITPGRHHFGTPGDIISECLGDFVGIRTDAPDATFVPVRGIEGAASRGINTLLAISQLNFCLASRKQNAAGCESGGEPEPHQLLAHRIGTDRMSHLGQGRRELLHAPRSGAAWDRPASRLDETFKCFDEPRIGSQIARRRGGELAPSAAVAHRDHLRRD
jgi:hypothetical protein